MTQPEKSCYSGQYKAEKEYINGGESMEELKFDSDTGNVTCYAEIKKQNEEMKRIYKQTDQAALWLSIVAVLVAICFLVGLL